MCADCSVSFARSSGVDEDVGGSKHPCFSSVESCADSVSLLFMANGEPADKTLEGEYDETAINYTLNHQITLGQVDDGGMLNEVASNAVFTKLGIMGPKQLFIPLRDERPQIYNDHGLSYPLVAKLVSQDLPHKSEYGAITLEISDLDTCACSKQNERKSPKSCARCSH